MTGAELEGYRTIGAGTCRCNISFDAAQLADQQSEFLGIVTLYGTDTHEQGLCCGRTLCAGWHEGRVDGC
jgi:hypothetical protein